MIEGVEPHAASGAVKPMTLTSAVNIPWLTSIPEHWKVVRSKGLFTARTERARPDDEQLSATQAYGVIPQKEFEIRVGRKVVRITQHLEKRAHVEPDDFVISMRSFQGGLERAWARGCIRSSYIVLKPSPQTLVGYFAHLFKSLNYIRALQATSNFIRDGQDLNFNNFSLVDLPLPPLAEQADIAKYLDHANRRIDGFIRAKRKLIGLLNEQKQAIIHRAVTRGCQPDVPLKPSGILWVGGIPEHWKLRRIRTCILDSRAGIWGTDPARSNKTDQIVCVRVADFDMQLLTIGIKKLTLRAVAESARTPRLLQRGDILLEKSGGGEAEPIGRVVLFNLEMPAISSNFIVRIRVDRSIVHPEFLLQVLAIMQKTRRNVPFIKQTTGIQNLNEKAYFSLPIGVPPLKEQTDLITALTHEVDPINTAIARTEREIALMQEYRTRLTADIVTGKLDVREAAAKLPDVAEVPPSIDSTLDDGEPIAEDESGND